MARVLKARFLFAILCSFTIFSYGADQSNPIPAQKVLTSEHQNWEVVSKPHEKLVIEGRMSPSWPSTTAFKDIPQKMDELAVRIFKEVTQKYEHKDQPPNAPYTVFNTDFLVACLYVRDMNRIFIASIPYSNVKDNLNDNHRIVLSGTKRASLHAEHHAYVLAYPEGDPHVFEDKLRYMSVYGITQAEIEWKAPCKGISVGCQDWLKARGVSYMGAPWPPKTPPKTPSPPPERPASPGTSKQKQARSLAMDDLMNVILDIREMQELERRDAVLAGLEDGEYQFSWHSDYLIDIIEGWD